MKAALLRRHEPMCLSMQFTDTLSLPPVNHFACGGFQSSTLLHFFDHCSCEACSAQNASGSFSACACRPPSETCAADRKAEEGANFLFSVSRASISLLMDLL